MLIVSAFCGTLRSCSQSVREILKAFVPIDYGHVLSVSTAENAKHQNTNITNSHNHTCFGCGLETVLALQFKGITLGKLLFMSKARPFGAAA